MTPQILEGKDDIKRYHGLLLRCMREERCKFTHLFFNSGGDWENKFPLCVMFCNREEGNSYFGVWYGGGVGG